MKIWCDSCNKAEASVFCSADEAALCDDCDLRVHQANKLASKHQRFSLLQPSSSSSHAPQCDICQEKKALFFCQQDRAILCRDCDESVHTANELTKTHNRFLLTGAKLSLLSSKSTKNKAKGDSANSELDPVPDLRSQSLTQFNSRPQPTESSSISHAVSNQQTSGEGGFTSSISEYLMEMLPGWQVEDLLDSSSDPVGFYKDNDDDGLMLLNEDLEGRISSYENNGLWVPQAPNVIQPSQLHSGIFKVSEIEGMKGKVSRKVARKNLDDGFTVPQISLQSKNPKRSRPIC